MLAIALASGASIRNVAAQAGIDRSTGGMGFRRTGFRQSTPNPVFAAAAAEGVP
jgi:hypothetical protein